MLINVYQCTHYFLLAGEGHFNSADTHWLQLHGEGSDGRNHFILYIVHRLSIHLSLGSRPLACAVPKKQIPLLRHINISIYILQPQFHKLYAMHSMGFLYLLVVWHWGDWRSQAARYPSSPDCNSRSGYSWIHGTGVVHGFGSAAGPLHRWELKYERQQPTPYHL